MHGGRSKSFTIVIVAEGGRRALELHLPRWTRNALRLSALLVAYLIGFVGWQLQALYGLAGPQMIELGMLPTGPVRFCLFEQAAPSKAGPSRAELARRIVMARAQRLGLGDRRAASLLLLGEVAPEWIAEAERGAPSDGGLLWPVRDGGFGRGFGSGEQGYHLAIDIAGERGADVLAAAPGVVGYAGRELRGYGNVVMIVHPGGRVTLYGHNQRNLVIAGERVYQGQTIAELGSTGRSMGPHLHFELKFAGRNCDPLPLMRPSGDEPERHLPAFTALHWATHAPKPAALRCAPRRMHPRGDADVDLVGSNDDLVEASPPG